jgi:hypothetical protein
MPRSADAPYRLGRAERRGAILGLRAGQGVAIAVGATALVAGLGAGGATAVAGLLVATGCAALVVVHVRGRGLDEWLPVAAAFAIGPRRGALAAGAWVHDDGALAHLRWPDGSATTIARLQRHGLRALDDDPRAVGESVAAWLRGLGTAGAERWAVSLVTVTGAGPTPPRDAPFIDAGVTSEALVAVTATRPVDVAAELATAGVAGAMRLDRAALESLLARRVAPASGSLLTSDALARWHHLEAPASVHAAFSVEEWPSGDVDEHLLAPLCVARDRRTVVLAVRVEELHRARRRTASVRTTALADESLAVRGGFLASSERARDATRDAERADELAAGHGSLRVVGVVALDAGDVLDLEAAAVRLLADASACGVRLRRCDGDHRRGVLASVPGWCVA